MKKLLVIVAALLLGGLARAESWPAPMLRQTAQSVVTITDMSGLGSGVVVGKNLILTCAHVVNFDKDDIVIVAWEYMGAIQTVTGSVVKLDKHADLALIKTTRDLDAPAVKVAGVDAQLYDRLWLVASPDGMPHTVTSEIVSDLFDSPFSWRVTGYNQHGESGGAIVDDKGQLQCIAEAVWNDKELPPFIGRCIKRPVIAGFLKP